MSRKARSWLQLSAKLNMKAHLKKAMFDFTAGLHSMNRSRKSRKNSVGGVVP